ncbi:MAG: MFS transporter [Cyanobacteria bacterium P01_E01_bin.6]
MWNPGKRLRKLVLLSSLYVSQYIPLMFLIQALPVFLRQQGVPLETIGLIYLLGFPLLLKIFWSPFIDRYGFTRWGHYRFWIVCFQLLVAGVSVLCAFVDIQADFTLMFALLLLMVTLAASQDIATDALAVGLLEPSERGWGNGIQMAGNYLGAILGGGVMLMLLNQLGWTNSVLILAWISVIALLPILRYREQSAKPVQTRPAFMDVLNFYSRPGIWRWLLVLAIYMTGGNMANGMFRPLLVDLGLSLAEIGWLLGVVGNGAAILGAIMAGLLTTSFSRKRSLVVFGIVQAVATLAYLLPASGLDDKFTLHIVTIMMHAAIGATLTVSATVMMDKSQLATAGTDYTAQSSVVYLGGFLAAGLSGFITAAIGYQGLFLLSIAIATLGVVLISQGQLERFN